MFSKERIESIATININVDSKDWIAGNINFSVVKDGYQTQLRNDFSTKTSYIEFSSKTKTSNIKQQRCPIKNQDPHKTPELPFHICTSYKQSIQFIFLKKKLYANISEKLYNPNKTATKRKV